MKKLTTGKIWQFAAGQFGWAMLSGIISNWLVYFYQPDETAISQGQTVFIPQGLVVLGIFTIIGGITAFGRIFDAFTDPMIASLSDRCTSKNGRRIPFLKWASLPLALSTVLVFWSPLNQNSWINAAFLLAMILAYYLSITAYCTPYNALIPELGHTQQERLNISTVISFTFIAGTAVAYLAPTIWGVFIPVFGRVGAIRVTFTIMAAVAFICMLVPVFTIREKDYVDTVPSKESAFGSLTATFKNGEFRKFVASDIFYWIALTMFQTGLPFFVTSLLKLPETMIRTCECILRENPQLAQVLESPVIRQSRKEAIIDRVFENPDFSRIMRNFLKKVCEDGCMDQMESMVRIRDEKSREAAGILSAKLRYVTEPDAAEVKAMKELLCKTYGKNSVELSMQEAPELIGGFVLQTGDVEYDYSLSGQLRRMFEGNR